MKVILTAIIVILLIFAAGFLYMQLGLYDISAARPEGAFRNWMFSHAMENSVKKQARNIAVPPLGDSAQLATGYVHFSEMCITCHGAPGIPRSDIGQGLNPSAPDLPKATEEWSDAELFWIIKNGIRMTGMPAFGATHSDDAIWALAAFVRRLEKMTPEEFREWTTPQIGEQGEPAEPEHHHH